MTDSEPSWASDTPITSQQVLQTEKDMLHPKLHREADLNRASLSTGTVLYLDYLAKVTVVYASDNVTKIFTGGNLLHYFHFSDRPNAVVMSGYFLLAFARDTAAKFDLISGVQYMIHNPFGRISFAKQVAEGKLLLASFGNISLVDASQMRSLRDMRARVACKLYCANEKFAVCGAGRQVQIFELNGPKSFVFECRCDLSCIYVFGCYFLAGETSGIVCAYQIDDLSFSTRKLKLVKQFCNLREKINIISVYPSGRYCFIQGGSEFRILCLEKLECCTLFYPKLSCRCCVWRGNELLLGKADGRVQVISVVE